MVSPIVSFPQATPPTPCAHHYHPPYAPHALPISFVSILPPAQYWVRSTDHSAPRYAAFSIPTGRLNCIRAFSSFKISACSDSCNSQTFWWKSRELGYREACTDGTRDVLFCKTIQVFKLGTIFFVNLRHFFMLNSILESLITNKCIFINLKKTH